MSDNTSMPDDPTNEIAAKDIICVALAQTTGITAGEPPEDVPLISVTFGGVDLFQALTAAEEASGDPRLVVASHDTTTLLMAPSGVLGAMSSLLSLLVQIGDPRADQFLEDIYDTFRKDAP